MAKKPVFHAEAFLKGVKQELDKIHERVSTIELEHNSVQDGIRLRDKQLKGILEAYTVQFSMIKESIGMLNKRLQQSNKQVSMMIDNFKHIARKEELDKLARKIDDRGFEKCVTRKEVEKVI